MPWKRMLAYVTGEIEESLLTRIEYLIEENRILRRQIQGRPNLTDPERKPLAEKAILLGKLPHLGRKGEAHASRKSVQVNLLDVG